MHIHAEGPAFFAWLPKMLGKRVVVTVHGIDWQREKWQSGLGSKFIHQGEKNAVKYADEVIVLSKGVQDYFKKTYDRETHFIPNGVNANNLVEGLVDDDKGFTNLIVQSSKGERILDRIADRYELYATNLEKAIELDGTMICHSAEPHPRRDKYYLNLDKETLRAHIQKFVPIRIRDYLIEKSKGIFYRMGVYKFLKNKK